MNRLVEVWRDHDPDISADPARAGVFIHGHGWTEAAHVVVQYGERLERFSSVVAAEQWLSQPTRTTPDRAWEEGRAGEIVREFSAGIAHNRVSLVESFDETNELDDEMVVVPAG
ncbi:MAG: hypothetical protein K2X55_20705 [Burkholderiaceae bacterium]|nr:hypothetical protein [Burkholderiaceae bacterium]